MIELDYQIDPHFAREMESHDLSRATSTDLEFRLFCSDIFFKVDGESLDARWSWIPVVGFAEQLFDAAVAAAGGTTPADLEFSENQEKIRFRLVANRLVLEPTYSPARPSVDPSEFLAAAREFLRKVTSDVARKWPAIGDGAAFQAVLQKATN